MSGFDNEIVFADGIDLSGNSVVANKLDTDGFIYFGNSAGNPVAGLPTSIDGSVTITPGNGTLDFKVSESTRLSYLGVLNLGMSISGGTLTIHSQDGTALSETNPGFVLVASNVNVNQFITYKLTSNFTIDQADINGGAWGTTPSTSWSQSLPLFIYFVSKSDDTAVIPVLARKWWQPTQFASGDLKVKGSTVPADEQDSISMVSGITASEYESTNTKRLGYFTATKNSSDNWTFDALTDLDGIGNFPQGRVFTMAIIQNGATSGFLSSSNGGDTLPTFTTQGYSYFLNEDRTFSVQWGHNPVTSAGVGTGNLRVHLPYSIAFTNSRISDGSFRMLDSSSSLYVTALPSVDTSSGMVKFVDLLINGNGTRKLQPQDWTTNLSNGSMNFSKRGMVNG